MVLLDKVKTACRVTTDAFDEELVDLIFAALADLGITDIKAEDLLIIDPETKAENILKPLIQRAVITYCRMNFGDPDDYERLKTSYDEQKAQMSMSGEYTQWTDQT